MEIDHRAGDHPIPARSSLGWIDSPRLLAGPQQHIGLSKERGSELGGAAADQLLGMGVVAAGKNGLPRRISCGQDQLTALIT